MVVRTLHVTDWKQLVLDAFISIKPQKRM